MKRWIVSAALAGSLMLGAGSGLAGEAEIVNAKATWAGGSWRFDVTVRHADTGWEHYADAWQIVGPDGTVYGVRTLYHPHVDEQPFTRSLTGVSIPASVGVVTVIGRDSVHGWGSRGFQVRLQR